MSVPWPVRLVLAGIAFSIVALSIWCAPEQEYCEEKTDLNVYECTQYSLPRVAFLKTVAFLNKNEGAVIGIGTIALAIGTLFLWNSTRNLWKEARDTRITARDTADAARDSANALVNAARPVLLPRVFRALSSLANWNSQAAGMPRTSQQSISVLTTTDLALPRSTM